jgi:hypothetical protein
MKIVILNIIAFLFFLVLLGSLNSCRENVIIEDITDTIETMPVELINTNISGQVKDNTGNVIAGADVKILSVTGMTDENGYFIFENIKADKNGTVIIVPKEGYYENRITVYPSLNHDLFSSITMTEDNSSATKLIWNGGDIQLGKYGTLYIEPNTLVFDSDGSNFQGSAEITYRIYDMNDPDFENLIPGDLTGYIGQKKVGLIPASVISINITDGKMNRLRLAREQHAELELYPSSRYIDSWTEEIGLWTYNTTQNKWMNLGEAVPGDSEYYIGQIDDFGIIAMAKAIDIVKMEGSVFYENENSTAHHTIEISTELQNETMRFNTDEQGYFTAFVPSESGLEMKVKNECGFVVLQETIETLNNDLNIQRQLMVNNACKTLPVSGLLVNCDAMPVSNGYVRIVSPENELFVHTDYEGRYQGEFKVCDPNVKIDITAYDLGRQVGTINHTGYPVENGIDIGKWKVCQESGSVGLQFRNSYYFLTENISYEFSLNSLFMYLGETEDLYIDCLINDFRGEDIYYIPKDITAEFLLTVLGKNENAPTLVPKTELALWTYKLIVEKYTANERIEGTIVGLARDTNHDDQDGMMFLKFDVPIVN